jgi:hypothetical protein
MVKMKQSQMKRSTIKRPTPDQLGLTSLGTFIDMGFHNVYLRISDAGLVKVKNDLPIEDTSRYGTPFVDVYASRPGARLVPLKAAEAARFQG